MIGANPPAAAPDLLPAIVEFSDGWKFIRRDDHKTLAFSTQSFRTRAEAIFHAAKNGFLFNEKDGEIIHRLMPIPDIIRGKVVVNRLVFTIT